MIGKLLQKEGSHLQLLGLSSIGMRDEESELLANSLKSNTSLVCLGLMDNDIKEEGHIAFLKLLNDVSSIDGTYNSNHALSRLFLPKYTNATIEKMKNHIHFAIGINQRHRGNSHEAGREKIIETQLNSNTRMELCHLQGIDYSYGSIFADIDPIILPEVLALVGGKYGQNEMYRMLLATAPDLATVVNRKDLLKQTIAKNAAMIAENKAMIAALGVKNAELVARTIQLKKDLASESKQHN